MISLNPKIEFISSLFTRNNGYTNIKSTLTLPRKKAISILNSFSPQGKSPDLSLRIGAYYNHIGAGYYYMISPDTIKISTLLSPINYKKFESIYPPLNEQIFSLIASGKQNYNLSTIYPYEDLYHILKSFNNETISSIIFSIMVGDNLIIVHPSHQYRLNFIGLILSIIPKITFNYNRITSNCSELDGNENIIGVAKLPKKYRSHKKLSLPIDTIFIDLEKSTVEGDGVKRSNFTNEISDLIFSDITQAQKIIYRFFTNIMKNNVNRQAYDSRTNSLIDIIEMKLGLRNKIDNDWILGF